MNILQSAEWRYATKKFDNARNVTAKEIEVLKRCVQLAPSSYGLQPYKVLIIEDLPLRKKLRTASWDQSQITDCSHFFVFCNYVDFSAEMIDEYVNQYARTQGIDKESCASYGDSVKASIAYKSAIERNHWAINQTYIALSSLLTCCAQLKIDACPMEGFEQNKYNEILDLTTKGLNACVIASVGYRATEDATQHRLKVRKPLELLFEEV